MLTLNQLKHLYTNAPLWVQKLYASVPYSIRNGSEFRQWYTFLQTHIDTENYQILKLKETLYYAYENVPYYTKLFNELQVSPFDLHEINDLKNFPLLTKKIIDENFIDLNAINYPKHKKFYVKTGGTTGTPATFYQSNNIWKKELAFVLDFFSHAGYKPSDWKASFKGGDFEELKEDNYWVLDPLNKSISFSPLHLNKNTLDAYCMTLNTYQPLYFHTYPSTLLFFIDLMIEEKRSLNYQPKAIFLVSEGYTEKDIEKIQTFFNFKTKVTSFYGQSERILFATAKDETLQIYHNDKRYGLLELIDEKHNQINTIHKKGTLVGTSFDNYAMPLIRYVTDDKTSYLDNNHETIQKITSLRTNIYFDAKNGEKISITFLSISSLTNNIYSFQFYQEKPGSLVLLLVPKKNFSILEKEKIYQAIYTKIGHIMDISVNTIMQPRRTMRGKNINVIKDYK